MCGLIILVFEHLEITSLIYVGQRLAYTQRVMRVFSIKKYEAVLLECKQLTKYLMGDNWTLDKLKWLSTDNFCN